MLSKYLWLSLLLGIVYILYSRNLIKEIKIHLIDGTLSIVDAIYLGLNEDSGKEPRIFTTGELKQYTNLEDGLYLSILGQVFDVTKGAKHYGPGGNYHAFIGNYFLCWKIYRIWPLCIWNYLFIGRDASLAFITGEFDNDGLTDDISSLSARQVKALDDWLQFYNTNYIYKGTIT